ncbi:hypothetical protein [Rhizobium mongolense]|uniref:Uncharacterized protein n=2 Tax=Rhizobium mongolense TaxID=57676 RepID=A0ABR6IKX4_9HYPH|nr:hypothetical protein [Rhizobium mongolense]MBB4228509.1 hypothetical protein [Rhizobium mongolense]TVZ64355.1 hypothetical protein BCL32_4596 [Rhizobium mongolense USDA 1844]
MTTEEYQPKYKWRETWPGEGHQDFVSVDGDLQFGRIYLDLTTSSRARQWRWAISAIPGQRQNILPHNGWQPTAREASRKVEELYEQIKALHGH